MLANSYMASNFLLYFCLVLGVTVSQTTIQPFGPDLTWREREEGRLLRQELARRREAESPPTSDTLQGLEKRLTAGRSTLPGRPGIPSLTVDDEVMLGNRRAMATAPPPAANRTVLRFLREPQTQLVPKGARVEMTCQVSISGVTIQWLRAGKPVETSRRKFIREEDGALVITKVRRDKNDEGTYQCKVLSDYGAMLSQPAQLAIANIEKVFSESPSNQSVPAGGAVLLRCRLESIPPARISWLRDGRPLPVNSSERFSADVAGLLSIRPVTSEDAGAYSCLGYNDMADRQRRSGQGTLTVTVPVTAPRRPVMLSDPPPERSLVRANASLIVPCVATGHPLPTITWTRGDGVPVPASVVTRVGSLNITSAWPGDAATYICTASNEAGRVIRHTAVEVLVPPVFTSSLPALRQLPRGYVLRLNCSATGWPVPNYSWVKDGRRLTLDAGRVRVTRGELMVGNLQSGDSGIYQCVAYGRAGYTAAAVHVMVGNSFSALQMEPPSLTQVTDITSRSARLSWTVAEGAVHLAYTIHIRTLDDPESQEIQEVVTKTWNVVHGLRPFTNYSVYVRAYSEEMASDPSQTVNFRTAEDVPSETPRVTLVAVSATELNVSWEALPASLSNGIITGYRINSQRHNDPATGSIVEVGADRHSYLLTGLEPGRAYDVRVLAATRVGFQREAGFGDDGPSPQWVQQKMPERSLSPVNPGPRPPTVRLVVSNHTTILISWTLPDSGSGQEAPPVGFKVLYRRQDLISDLQGPIRLPADTFEHYLTNLVPNTWYEVHVQTVSADNQTAEAIKTISTLPVDGSGFELERPVLEPPVDLWAKALNATAVLIRWQRPPSARTIQYYTVKYRPLGTDNSQPEQLRSTDDELAVTGLEPFTYYEFTVRSHDADNTYGPFSDGKRIRTLEGAPSPPLNVTWTPVDASRIRVSWRPPRRPHGQITGYRVLYTSAKELPIAEWQRLDIPSSSGTQMRLSQLVPNQQYRLRVRARTAAAVGQLSDIVEFEIKAILQSSTPTPAPAIHGTPYIILTGVLVVVVVLAAAALLWFCWRRRNHGRQWGAAAAARPHLNGAAGSGAAAAAAASDHVEMEVLTPMLTHVTPAADHQLDTKGGHQTNKPANGSANGFVHPLYLSTDRLRRGSSDPHNESRVSLINNNSSLLSGGGDSSAGEQPP